MRGIGKWQAFSDNHTFTLFWAPLDNLPDIIPPQKTWLDILKTKLPQVTPRESYVLKIRNTQFVLHPNLSHRVENGETNTILQPTPAPILRVESEAFVLRSFFPRI